MVNSRVRTQLDRLEPDVSSLNMREEIIVRAGVTQPRPQEICFSFLVCLSIRKLRGHSGGPGHGLSIKGVPVFSTFLQKSTTVMG